jgi:hypothetical protein
MPASHVDQAVLVAHAKGKVNIWSEDAAKRRAQVNHLRTRLETYIAAHRDYDLVKLRASGSTAKHTAIRRRRGEGLGRRRRSVRSSRQRGRGRRR